MIQLWIRVSITILLGLIIACNDLANNLSESEKAAKSQKLITTDSSLQLITKDSFVAIFLDANNHTFTPMNIISMYGLMMRNLGGNAYGRIVAYDTEIYRDEVLKANFEIKGHRFPKKLIRFNRVEARQGDRYIFKNIKAMIDYGPRKGQMIELEGLEWIVRDWKKNDEN